jgi:hypothetical protein
VAWLVFFLIVLLSYVLVRLSQRQQTRGSNTSSLAPQVLQVVQSLRSELDLTDLDSQQVKRRVAELSIVVRRSLSQHGLARLETMARAEIEQFLAREAESGKTPVFETLVRSLLELEHVKYLPDSALRHSVLSLRHAVDKFGALAENFYLSDARRSALVERS